MTEDEERRLRHSIVAMRMFGDRPIRHAEDCPCEFCAEGRLERARAEALRTPEAEDQIRMNALGIKWK